MADTTNQRDLVLAPGEFAYVQDETKGQVDTHVGPLVSNLSGTQRTVIFDQNKKKFSRAVSLEAGVQNCYVAPEGWYLVIYNPAKGDKAPEAGQRNTMPPLTEGHKIIIPGPVNFVPWPAQMVKRVQGHQLRSNQYLLIRVYDAETAQSNFEKVFGPESEKNQVNKTDLTVGRTFVIRGTEVNFFIPPTGIEVVKDENDKFIRDAVTLERLEYCVLIDEDGDKRNVRGPAVVFPNPTEIFKMTKITKDGEEKQTRKFRAYELTENSGIHLKVIAPYQDHKEGEELFITGKAQMLFFPPEELAIIKYEGREIHYAIAIPKGEARYVMNRNTGNIRLEKGPSVFLADPRNEVVVLRALDLKMVGLLYPNNVEALQHNQALLGVEVSEIGAFLSNSSSPMGDIGSEMLTKGGVVRGGAQSYVSSNAVVAAAAVADTARGRGLRGMVARDFGGDAFDRKQQFTPPRTIILNTKYDGVVTTSIWPGYAVQLVGKSGVSRVIVGPEIAQLEYDELPQILKLSTGTPKSGKNPIHTVFLRVTANKVSDVVEVETKDFVKVNVTLSYRLNFEGDKTKWFSIEDYVSFLTDTMRSVVRNAVQKITIQEFYQNSTDVLRDIVLGQASIDGERSGRIFQENGMRIYGLDVTNLGLDKSLEQKLIQAQRVSFEQGIEQHMKTQALAFKKDMQKIELETLQVLGEVEKAKLDFDKESTQRTLERELAIIAANSLRFTDQMKFDKSKVDAETELQNVHLARERASRAQDLSFSQQETDLYITELQAEAKAVIDKAAAVSPDLIAALESFGNRAVLEDAMKAMSPLAILGGTSVSDVVQKLFAGTALEKLSKLAPTNGSTPKLPSAQA